MQGVGQRGCRACRDGGQTRGIVCRGRGREEAGHAGEVGGGDAGNEEYGARIKRLRYTMQNIPSYPR